MDDVLIIPPDGGIKDTARLLLSLAGDVPEIVRTTNAGNAFVIPSGLADAYHAALEGTAATTKRATRRRSKE